LGASGGGCNTLIPAQSWQTGLSVWASTACGTHRLAADISAVAGGATHTIRLTVKDNYGQTGTVAYAVKVT